MESGEEAKAIKCVMLGVGRRQSFSFFFSVPFLFQFFKFFLFDNTKCIKCMTPNHLRFSRNAAWRLTSSNIDVILIVIYLPKRTSSLVCSLVLFSTLLDTPPRSSKLKRTSRLNLAP